VAEHAESARTTPRMGAIKAREGWDVTLSEPPMGFTTR